MAATAVTPSNTVSAAHTVDKGHRPVPVWYSTYTHSPIDKRASVEITPSSENIEPKTTDTKTTKSTTLSIDLVPDYLFLAIVSVFVCFPPLGLIATYKASLALKALARGDYVTAKKLSDQARCYILLSILIGNVIYIIIIIIVVFVLAIHYLKF